MVACQQCSIGPPPPPPPWQVHTCRSRLSIHALLAAPPRRCAGAPSHADAPPQPPHTRDPPPTPHVHTHRVNLARCRAHHAPASPKCRGGHVHHEVAARARVRRRANPRDPAPASLIQTAGRFMLTVVDELSFVQQNNGSGAVTGPAPPAAGSGAGAAAADSAPMYNGRRYKIGHFSRACLQRCA